VETQCWSNSLQKRAFDVVVSAVVLSATLAIAPIVWALIKITSEGPGLFCQHRVGLNGRLFTVYKFRTMTLDAGNRGVRLTREGDSRLTPVGRVLRKLKLDEIPQFYNVLIGDMSLVGPRPKLPEYSSETDWKYRPGITGLATLAFRCEEELLKDIPAHELAMYYDAEIKPLKARLDRWYMRRASFASDLKIIWNTAAACVAPRPLQRRKVAVATPARQTEWVHEQESIAVSLETESVD
jgi:lipopolysaccharide/colanic/teichoic acid biosynthesis glycosyltransferase